MSGRSRLLALPVRSAAELVSDLHELAELARQGQPGVLPVATFHLRSGRAVKGQLLAFQRQGGLLLVHAQGGGELDVTYLALEELEALTIHYTSDTLHLLSGGRLLPHTGEAPGRLELKRRLTALVQELSRRIGETVTGTIAWDDFPETDSVHQGLSVLLGEADLVLKEVASDSEGVAALSRSARELQIRPTSQGPGVIRNGALLTLLIDLRSGEPAFLRGRELRSAIEKLL